MKQIMERHKNISLENIVEYIEGEGWITERWAPIPEWEDFYEISIFGRIKFLKREFVGKNGQLYKFKEKIKQLTPNSTNKYLMVTLTHNETNRHETICVHRLVGLVFLPNPNGLPEVDHKFGDKNKISIYDLQWATHSENMKSAYSNGQAQAISGTKHIFSRRVGQYLNGKLVKEYDMMSEAANAGFGIDAVRQAILNNWKCGGFEWKYLSARKWKRRSKLKLKKPIGAFDGQRLVKKFKNIDHAKKKGFDKSNIYKSIRDKECKMYGYYWKYLDEKNAA